MTRPVSHWQNYPEFWSLLASPLRPCGQDLEIFARELEGGGPTLLLGVTREIGGLARDGVAIDNSRAMIAELWPPRPGWRAVQGDWLALPFAAGAFARIVGDGALSMVRFPADYRRLFGELARVCAGGGKILLRLFLRPETPEPVGGILRDLERGAIPNFHVLKWRLAMALAKGPAGYNVAVAELLALFEELFPDRERLLRQTGWPPEVLATIDVYRSSAVNYSFPPLSALEEILAGVAGDRRLFYGDYGLAERCPILLLGL